jgi:hypothetical protein
MASYPDIPQCQHYKHGTQCTIPAHRWDEPSRTYLCIEHYLEAVRLREWQQR